MAQMDYESFWTNRSFAVVGHAAKKNFPRLTYRRLKKLGKVVFPVDPSAIEIEGDRAYADLDALPEKVDAVVLEVPREETKAWVGQTSKQRMQEPQRPGAARSGVRSRLRTIAARKRSIVTIR